MAEPILEVSALTKHFGGLRAVHLSLAVDAGELRCLIGPNGAGKSTFFRILSGGMRPSSGTVRFRGRDITGWAAFQIARLGIGMASVGEPALILLDEPTAGMTVEEVKKTVRLLKRLNETATVIVVEHDMNFIRMIARRVTVMHQGEVFAEGSMEEIEVNESVRDIYLGKGTHYA